MQELDVPTARFEVAKTKEAAQKVCEKYGFPIVFKYSGLAAGKGVIIIKNEAEKKYYLEEFLEHKSFGDDELIIEEFLEGVEFSTFYMVHNNQIVDIGVAQDYKCAKNDEKGLNTGGMGAHTTDEFNQELHEIKQTIIKPIIEKLNYSGFLYAGLIKTKDGIKVIEFNCRLGDPEAQVILQKLASPLIESIIKIKNDETVQIKFNQNQYLGVVIASCGYPQEYRKNLKLKLPKHSYHMGTKLVNKEIFSTGGRIFIVCGKGKTIKEAASAAYKQIKPQKYTFYRSDIGYKGEK
jgi:phosphoribosylamine---glycine ligase